MRQRVFFTRARDRVRAENPRRDKTENRPQIRGSRQARALGLAGVGLCAALALSVDARAAERLVALGEVGAGTSERSEHTDTLRQALQDELDQIDFGRHRPRQRYVISARLVKLDSATDNRAVRATCVVSLVLRRERGSTLEAVINGRATVEETRSETESAKATALRAAVHSAVRRVPETVKASER